MLCQPLHLSCSNHSAPEALKIQSDFPVIHSPIINRPASTLTNSDQTSQSHRTFVHYKEHLVNLFGHLVTRVGQSSGNFSILCAGPELEKGGLQQFIKMDALKDHQSRYGWLVRYKLYHLPFWFAYHCLWWTLTIGSFREVINNIFFSPYAVKFLFSVVFQAIAVYFNLYFLIPRFLEKGRYISYISLLLLTILGTAALLVSGYYVGAWWAERPFKELYGTEPSAFLYLFNIRTLPSTVASVTLAMSIKLTKHWLGAQRKQQLLEKEQLETELKFLKSQFNPHFLFNTINSIFVLIHKNPDMASESLAKFSDLLRYQLYECNEAQIPLGRELDYFDNFIELEKLRQDHNVQLTIQMQRGGFSNLTIAPFILMPFVENAFKHVSQRSDSLNWIDIRLSLSGREVDFTISNSVSATEQAAGEVLYYGGLGLKNVQRRLNLLYPGEYDLDIQRNEQQFRVRLRLTLSEQSVAKRAREQLVPLG